jgi:hypothetical protein
MSERAGKWQLALSVLILLSVGFIIYRSFHPLAFSSDYSPTNDQVTTDIIGKSVALPQGQVWGFNPDQRLDVKVIGRRQVDYDGVVVTVELNASVNFPPPPKEGPNAPKAGDPPPPKKATLSGMAKVYYERHNGAWYCTNVEGINLKVQAE